MRPPIDVLERAWLFSYARSSLIEAMLWLEQLNFPQSNASQTSALISAAVVAYARPFSQSQITKSKRAIALKDVHPPTNLAQTHQDLIDLRNKTIGHKDATTFDDNSASPNVILIERYQGGFCFHTRGIKGMDQTLRDGMALLCKHFIAHCEQENKLLIKPYENEVLQLPFGVHELLITEHPEPWSRPYTL